MTYESDNIDKWVERFQMDGFQGLRNFIGLCRGAAKRAQHSRAANNRLAACLLIMKVPDKSNIRSRKDLLGLTVWEETVPCAREVMVPGRS